MSMPCKSIPPISHLREKKEIWAGVSTRALLQKPRSFPPCLLTYFFHFTFLYFNVVSLYSLESSFKPDCRFVSILLLL
jgi:hypothetical protein